jgi:hypothetical protein
MRAESCNFLVPPGPAWSHLTGKILNGFRGGPSGTGGTKVLRFTYARDVFLAPLCTGVRAVVAYRTLSAGQYLRRHPRKNIARIREDFLGPGGPTHKSGGKCVESLNSGGTKVGPICTLLDQLFIESGERVGI